ncbi:MAG: RNA polymerase sigma factor [Gammaproteobacteria bacterium]
MTYTQNNRREKRAVEYETPTSSTAGEPDPAVHADVKANARLATLVTRMAGRDQTALVELYEATVGRLFALAMLIGEDTWDAEETVSDTYVQAWEEAASYGRSRTPVSVWLITICRTRALDKRRQRLPRAEVLDGHAVQPRRDQPDEPAEDLLAMLATSSRAHAGLAALDPVRRQVLAFAYLRGFSHSEISQHTGLALGTVKSHLRRGLADLRRFLGSTDDE